MPSTILVTNGAGYIGSHTVVDRIKEITGPDPYFTQKIYAMLLR